MKQILFGVYRSLTKVNHGRTHSTFVIVAYVESSLNLNLEYFGLFCWTIFWTIFGLFFGLSFGLFFLSFSPSLPVTRQFSKESVSDRTLARGLWRATTFGVCLTLMSPYNYFKKK